MGDRALSVQQAADELAVSTDKILRLIQAGQLRAVDTSIAQAKPRWRILPDDWQAFLAGRKSQPDSPAPRRRKPRGNRPSFF